MLLLSLTLAGAPLCEQDFQNFFFSLQEVDPKKVSSKKFLDLVFVYVVIAWAWVLLFKSHTHTSFITISKRAGILIQG